MGRVCSMHCAYEKCIEFWSEDLEARDYLEDLHINERVISFIIWALNLSCLVQLTMCHSGIPLNRSPSELSSGGSTIIRGCNSRILV